MRFAPVLLFSLACAASAAPMKPAAHKPEKPILDTLFAQLAKAQSTEEAKPIEDADPRAVRCNPAVRVSIC